MFLLEQQADAAIQHNVGWLAHLDHIGGRICQGVAEAREVYIQGVVVHRLDSLKIIKLGRVY